MARHRILHVIITIQVRTVCEEINRRIALLPGQATRGDRIRSLQRDLAEGERFAWMCLLLFSLLSIDRPVPINHPTSRITSSRSLKE